MPANNETSLQALSSPLSPLERDVLAGLQSSPRRLPSYLFYDEEGSRLYEQITELEEYYPTRTERSILERHADEIVELVAQGTEARLQVIELGAGTASKTQLLLQAVVARQKGCVFVPIDVSSSALDEARAKLQQALPAVEVRPFVGYHQEAFPTIARLGPRRLVLFIGSSVGNFEDDEAIALLRGVRQSLSPGGALLLGTDLRKSPSIVLPAYDDALGVTAAFNKNMLARLNRELGANFDVEAFRHVALWNEGASRIEMHLESQREQRVLVPRLGRSFCFSPGERIHTESSIKYDLPRVDRLLEASGFHRQRTFSDPGGLFAVHLARA
ncbi:MAG: L-histidine N(alpha)-methyltransferase [Polyangiaceae bacterium]|jgi:dimethylhistidine N-methyltransferase|nr:L-histidine N(alpha)-methyltransferase [Polyangiaceae bacterium]